jgi:hypothetical protein
MSSPKPPLTTTTSIWPAATVLLTAIGMLSIFMILNAVTDTPVASTTTLPIIVGGLPVATGPSSGANVLANCHQYGTPPDDILNGFILPTGTQPRGPFRIVNAGAGEFDCRVPLTSTTSSAKLLGFYASQLGARGWTEFSSGATNGKPQLLFQKPGSDTFYYVLGVTVNEERGGRTQWTFRIYQNSNTI